jgi:hypothetical protein
MQRLSDQIHSCQEQAALVRIRAITAATPQMRREYKRLERHWRQLAATLGFAKKVSGYLEWRSRRLEVPEQ